MDILSNILNSTLTTQLASVLQKNTNIEDGKISSLVQMGIPMLLKQINTNATTNATQLTSALTKHDGSILDNLTTLSDQTTQTDGMKILSHVFGDNLLTNLNKLANTTGNSVSDTEKVLGMLAPVVMGILGKQSASGQDIQGILSSVMSSDLLSSPLVKGFLDKDGDGNIETSDILGLASKFFNQK